VQISRSVLMAAGFDRSRCLEHRSVFLLLFLQIQRNSSLCDEMSSTFIFPLLLQLAAMMEAQVKICLGWFFYSFPLPFF